MPHLSADDRRREFVKATIKVIAEEGVAKATTRRIAEVANAPAASLHYCFDSKDDLFRAVMERGLQDGRDSVHRGVRPAMGLHDAVEVIARGYLEWVVSDLGMQRAQFELLFWALRSSTSKHLPTESYRSYVDDAASLLQEALAPGDDPSIDLRLLASRIVALIDGHTLQAIALGDLEVLQGVEQGIREMQSFLVRGSAASA